MLGIKSFTVSMNETSALFCRRSSTIQENTKYIGIRKWTAKFLNLCIILFYFWGEPGRKDHGESGLSVES